MVEIADYAFAKGFRNPLFLAGPNPDSTRLMRKDTFLSRWQALMPGDAQPGVVHVPEYAMALAYRHLLDHLQATANRPDIVVCENDVLTLGAMDAIRQGLGLRVPQDIAVTGFDDIPLTASPAYDVTTCCQPISDMVRALVKVLEDGGRSGNDVVLPGSSSSAGLLEPRAAALPKRVWLGKAVRKICGSPTRL